jgi:hypothetical protein
MFALPGHLLEAVLEQDMPVGRLQSTGVVDVDLVLARCRFAFAEFHRNPGRAHFVAEAPVERLRLGGLEQVVVLVVPPEGLQVVEVLLRRPLVAVAQEVELELARHQDFESRLPGTLDLPAEHRTRRNRDRGTGRFILYIGEHQRGLLQPGNSPERGPVRDGEVVAVAGLPAHQPVTGRGPHLHVGAEEIGAEVRAVAGVIEEEVARHTLPHQPPLKVGDGADDGVDGAVADARFEPLQIDQ